MVIAKCPDCVEGDDWQEKTIEQIVDHLRYNNYDGYEYVTRSGWRIKIEKLPEKKRRKK
jgi:hypothetical protein